MSAGAFKLDTVGALNGLGIELLPTVAKAVDKSQLGFIGCCLLYAIVSLGLRTMMGRTKPRRSSDIAQSGQAGSPLADVIAYNVVALVFAMGCSYIGVAAWFDGSAAAVGGSLQDRMYGYSRPMELLGIATAAYELFNVLCCFILPEYRTVAFIGHHATTFILALMSFYPWLHYYAIFFFGVATVSSVPLCWGEFFNAIGFPVAKQGCDVLFALSFVAIRTVYWPIVSYFFWLDSLAMLRGQGPVPVHSVGCYLFLLLANIGLTSLQFIWTGQIVREVKKALGGGGAEKQE